MWISRGRNLMWSNTVTRSDKRISYFHLFSSLLKKKKKKVISFFFSSRGTNPPPTSKLCLFRLLVGRERENYGEDLKKQILIDLTVSIGIRKPLECFSLLSILSELVSQESLRRKRNNMLYLNVFIEIYISIVATNLSFEREIY